MEFEVIEDLLREDSKFGPESSRTSTYRLLEASLAYGRLDAQSVGWDPFYLLGVLVGDINNQLVTQFPGQFAHSGLTPALVADLLHEDAGNPSVVDEAARYHFDLMQKMHANRRARVEGTGAITLPRDVYSSGEFVIPLLVSTSPRIERAYRAIGLNAFDRMRIFSVTGSVQDLLMDHMVSPLSA